MIKETLKVKRQSRVISNTNKLESFNKVKQENYFWSNHDQITYNCPKTFKNDLINNSLPMDKLNNITVTREIIKGVCVTEHFKDINSIDNQLKVYNKIFHYINLHKTMLTKLMKSARAMGITQNLEISLNEKCLTEDHYFDNRFSTIHKKDIYEWVEACYGRNTIYIFANPNNYNKRITYNNMRHTLLHEFGHFIESKLYRIHHNKYSSLVKKDFKMARLHTRQLKYEKFRKYYEHVTPPTKFVKFKKHTGNTYSAELFAESLTSMLLIKKKKKTRRNNKNIHVFEMFPHTRYTVEQFLKGKSVNKYKTFKKPKFGRIIGEKRP